MPGPEKKIRIKNDKPGFFSTFICGARHVLGNENNLSKTPQIGREAKPANPIHGAHITITEPAAVTTHELTRINLANDPDAQKDRRTRKLPPVKQNAVSINQADRIKLANDPEAIEKRRTRSRTN